MHGPFTGYVRTKKVESNTKDAEVKIMIGLKSYNFRSMCLYFLFLFFRHIQRKHSPPNGYHGIYAIDCEMCYTTNGMEVMLRYNKKVFNQLQKLSKV